ncbi:hypothetical protein PRIPAC_70267 [Pristionchus pacificus]|uniref:Uncharacterized protein n=1 Tax=Pristionchus pacificus TaxID=54126 RepID=A0A2A6CRL5_PRIPA|nr:hypothetical protein PRIPAC_70267 [Pristionchus pacificus]|eukprot:PDM80760.1 hypothetical protein PRIPAC_35763 [Pristionchus pacificus]
MNDTPEKCTALNDSEITGDLKQYQYVKIIRTRTETPTKTTFYKAYAFPSLLALLDAALLHP